MLSLTGINTRLAPIHTEITCIQTDVDKMYMYLEKLATNTVSPVLILPFTVEKVLQNIRRGMAQQHNIFS